MSNNQDKNKKIKKLKKEIADLEKRMPAHSQRIEMIQKLEELKIKLEKLQKN
jgi:predicted RNase H-like nuclease (RuvC/YqgF family)